MFFGEKLFGSENNNGHIINQPYVIIPQNISLEAQTFLLSMLQKDSNKRLSAKELLKHDFIIKGKKPDLNIVTYINNENGINMINSDRSNIANKFEEKNYNISNTPMNRNKYKTLTPEDRLRFSAKLSKPNPKKLQTILYNNINNTINNHTINNNTINNAVINKSVINDNINTEPMIGPHLKREENKIRKIKNIKNLNINKTGSKIYSKKNINANTNIHNINNGQHICKINNVGKNINRNQFKVIIDSCVKACLQFKGKILTATKAAKDIQKFLGDNWLVFISNINSQNYDFCLSSGKKDDYVSFSLDDKLFQILKYN